MNRIHKYCSTRCCLAAAILFIAFGGLGTLMTANAQPAIHSQQLIGVVWPSQSVMLTPQLSGKLTLVNVKVNDTVKKGDVIATLDDLLQATVVESAESRANSTAAIESATAQLEEAEVQLEREKKLVNQNASGEWQVRRAEVAVKRAKAELTRALEQKIEAEIELKLEKEKLARYNIRAPFDGRITVVEGQIGATVDEQNPVATIISIHPLKARLSLPKTMWGKLEVGKKYEFMAGNPIEKKILGTLDTIAPQIDYGSGTFRVEFIIENKDGQLPPGFEVTLIWPQDAQTAAE